MCAFRSEIEMATPMPSMPVDGKTICNVLGASAVLAPMWRQGNPRNDPLRKQVEAATSWIFSAVTSGKWELNHHWLVVWNMFYNFPYIYYIYIWYGNNHPNWRTQVFQRGRSTTSGGWQQLIAHGSNHGTERRHQHFGASLPLSYLSSTMARWEVPERNSTWGHRIICRCRKCVIFHWQVWLLEGTVANLMVHPSLFWRSAFPCFSLQRKCRTEAGNRVPYRILFAQLG